MNGWGRVVGDVPIFPAGLIKPKVDAVVDRIQRVQDGFILLLDLLDLLLSTR